MIYKYDVYGFISYLVYRTEQSKIGGKSREKVGRKNSHRKTYQKSNY